VKADEPKDIEKILRDGTAIDRALRAATREAIHRHKQAGVPVAIWKNGKTVWVDAEELEKPRRTGKKRSGSS
jgi:hypothetical protein